MENQLCDLYRQVITKERELCLALERIDAYRDKIEEYKLQQQLREFEVNIRPVLIEEIRPVLREVSNMRRKSLNSSRFVKPSRKTSVSTTAIPSYYTSLPKAQFEQHERIVHQLETKLEVGNLAIPREMAVKSLLTPAAKSHRPIPHEHVLLKELKAGALKLRPTTPVSSTIATTPKPDPNNHSMGALLLRTLNSRRHSLTGLDNTNQVDDEDDEDNKENDW
ncbi:hypothetical protein BASA81_003685 [Batrachochytrium salamandrivorans]|nr:hypothetical protein BASA81_003685 [Batrachochytrium salamandrivorans]